MSLEKCTLCDNLEDPRFGLMSKEGVFYALCDGCSPAGEGADRVKAVADACRATGEGTCAVPKFGVNEP